MTDSIKRLPGRPIKENKLTSAQKQAAYRDRQRIELVRLESLNNDLLFRNRAFENRIAGLESLYAESIRQIEQLHLEIDRLLLKKDKR